MTATTCKPRRRQWQKRPNLELIGLRINAGLSRDDLAARVGCSRETIRLIEVGQQLPGARLQGSIAKVFQRQPLEIWPIEIQRGVR